MGDIIRYKRMKMVRIIPKEDAGCTSKSIVVLTSFSG